LATGFVPKGRLGGEESFKGQANSLWLWQHDIGAMVVAGAAQDYLANPVRATERAQMYHLAVESRAIVAQLEEAV
jgi:hypothetical protein